MIRLGKELAVIGATNELLLQHREPFINFNIVCKYTRMLENRSGYAVLHGFSEKSLQEFLCMRENLFRYDYAETVIAGKPTYRLLVNNLLPMCKNELAMDEHQIKTLVRNMMDCLDPALNYPIAFLEYMGLIDILKGS